jgi:hypothetical protein
MKFRFLLLYLSAAFLVILISGTILPFSAKASSSADVSIDMAPENPAPNENTTVTLSSYTDDLNSVLITWFVNGKKSSSGIGQKNFSLKAPTMGEKTTVMATISLFDGDIDESVTVEPSIMTMLWQANDSYVPPFYEGKAMPSAGSEVKVVAIPEIKNGVGFVDPTNMTYDWQLNSTNDENNSGYAKNFYIYTSDYLDSSDDVTVTTETLDQKYSIDGSVNVSTVDPKIEFYKKDSTLGTIWEQALSDGYKVVGNQTIQAAPYFISPKDIRIPFLTFDWSVNDQTVAVPTYSDNFLPLIVQAGTSGTSKISLEVNNVQSLTDTASKDLNVQF